MISSDLIKSLQDNIENLRGQKAALLSDIESLDEALNAQNAIKADIVNALRYMSSPVSDDVSYRELAKAVKNIPLDWYDRIRRLEKSIPNVAKTSLMYPQTGSANLCFTVKDGTGVPTAEDLATVKNYIKGGLPNGVQEWFLLELNVRAATAMAVNVTMSVKVRSGTLDDVKGSVEQAVKSFFTPYLLNEGISLADFRSEILRRASRYISDCTISSPSSDFAASPYFLYVPGTITVKEMTN